MAPFQKHQTAHLETTLIDLHRPLLPAHYFAAFSESRFTQPMGGVDEPQSSENSRVPQKSSTLFGFYLPDAFIAAGDFELESGRGGQTRKQAETERVSHLAPHEECFELTRVEVQ